MPSADGSAAASCAGSSTRAVAEAARSPGLRDKRVERVAVLTGTHLVDQFEPWYFGVAFAFLFKYCTGMPDMLAFRKDPRFRREAPFGTIGRGGRPPLLGFHFFPVGALRRRCAGEEQGQQESPHLVQLSSHVADGQRVRSSQEI